MGCELHLGASDVDFVALVVDCLSLYGVIFEAWGRFGRPEINLRSLGGRVSQPGG